MEQLLAMIAIIGIIFILSKIFKAFSFKKDTKDNGNVSLADKPWPAFPDNDDLLDRECYNYQEETYDEFRDRYDGFGKEIYDMLQQKHPGILNHFRFYKMIGATGKCAYQPDYNASYAVYKEKFTIILDFYSTITVGNYEFSREFGDWNDNAVEDATEFVNGLTRG